MEKVVIVSGVRTPIGAYGGTLKDLHVTKYAGLALNEAVKRAKIEPDRVDDVIMGQSYQMENAPTAHAWRFLDAGWPEKSARGHIGSPVLFRP